MSDAVWVALIEAVPLVLAAVAALVIVLAFRRPLAGLMASANKVTIGTFSLEVAGAALAQARPDKPVSNAAVDSLVHRTKDLAKELAGLRILWVDDQPLNNRYERAYLRAAGVCVVNALDTAEALDHLRRDDYHLVISDFARGGDVRAGIELAERARENGHRQPFVGYIGQVDRTRGVPTGFFRVTDRPDELVEAVLALARTVRSAA